MRSSTLRKIREFRLDSVRRIFFSQEKAPSRAAPQSTTQSPHSNTIENHVARTTQQSRLDRLLKRTPKFLHRHVVSLRSAPITHISAFLILHELTAVVPLLGLAGAFHYYQWLPKYFSEGAWVVAGVEKFGRYFKRKGWISDDEEQEAENIAQEGDTGKVEHKRQFDSGKWWNKGEGSVRIVIEFATAYAIVKALLVPRLMLSAWGAPWFARWTVIPALNGFKRLFGRSKALGKQGGTS